MNAPLLSWLIKKSNNLITDNQSVYNWSVFGGTSIRVNGIAPVGRTTYLYEYLSGTPSFHAVYKAYDIVPDQNDEITILFVVKPMSRSAVRISITDFDNLNVAAVNYDLLNIEYTLYYSNEELIHPFCYRYIDDYIVVGLTATSAFNKMGTYPAINTASIAIFALTDYSSNNANYAGEGLWCFQVWKAFVFRGGLKHPFYSSEVVDPDGAGDASSTDAVPLFLDEDYKSLFEHTGTSNRSFSGTLTNYFFSSFKSFKFRANYVSLADALKLNNWWFDKEELIFHDGLTDRQYKCCLSGSKPPFDSLEKFYISECECNVEIEVIEDVSPN